jgi:hypothetical protein
MPKQPTNENQARKVTQTPIDGQIQKTFHILIPRWRLTLGMGRERSHTSRLTIVQMITLPPSGGFSGGRSTIAEYGLRSCGVMEPSCVHRRDWRQRRCLNLKPSEGSEREACVMIP